MKKNPLKLNPLQLRTLALFQVLADLPSHSQDAEEKGARLITEIPHAHGDHMHLGPYAVHGGDASGFHNASVWVALERKGLIKSSFPDTLVVTPEGLAYDTGLKDQIVHGSDH
jgi:hypothetical protein